MSTDDYLTNRDSFENFKSNICHRIKDIGELDFVSEILIADLISDFYKKEWFPECLYTLAMVDYLSRKNEIPLYSRYDYLRSCKLDEILYPSGIIMQYQLFKDESILKDSFDNAIPEFKRFNIVENGIDDIA